jgi:hypothetical protein
MRPSTYSIKFRLVKHLITFPVYLKDQGPFDFWLDTGGPGLVIKRSLADKLKLKIVDTGKKGVELVTKSCPCNHYKNSSIRRCQA